MRGNKNKLILFVNGVDGVTCCVCTSVLVWFCASASCPLMSSESTLEADTELTLEREERLTERASWSLAPPTEPARLSCELLTEDSEV